MPDENTKGGRLIRLIRILAIGITTVLLLTTLVFLFLESRWVEERPSPSPEEAFLYGLAGTEVLPLPVFKVLPFLFPDQFQPAGSEAGDWVEQFGFIRGKPDVNEGLPQGFSVSNYRPRSGSPSPVKFVGFNCSLCHTSMIKRSEEDEGVMVHGMGSTSLDFIAWVDALRTALLDEERLTMETIEEAYEKEFEESFGLMEGLMVRLWLTGIRSALKESNTRYDEPYHGAELRDAKLMVNGPGRTQPFRNPVRSVLNRPRCYRSGYVQVPSALSTGSPGVGTIRWQCRRSVDPQRSGRNRHRSHHRQSGAARCFRECTAGHQVFRDPERTSLPGDLPRSDSGCGKGRKGDGRSTCSIATTATELRDPMEPGSREVARVKWCRSKNSRRMPNGSRFATTTSSPSTFTIFFLKGILSSQNAENLRPGPRGTTKGYLNMPMDSAFARAPYLHNGSVLTMVELINLKPRREVFYRGDNVYDPIDLGLIAPDQPDVRHYYEMDTRRDGNSRKGHDYPWPYEGPGWDKAALEDLLEYMKTL